MDRNEAKTLMRHELEQDIDVLKRDQKMFPIGDRLLSANDLMSEVEQDTDLGKFLLDDFIAFKNGDTSPGTVLTAIDRNQALTMMEDDIKHSPAGWADEVIFSENGQSWTPNQVLDEVKRSTDFGNRFVQTYLANHRMLESLLGKGYDQEDDLFGLPPVNAKVDDGKTN